MPNGNNGLSVLIKINVCTANYIKLWNFVCREFVGLVLISICPTFHYSIFVEKPLHDNYFVFGQLNENRDLVLMMGKWLRLGLKPIYTELIRKFCAMRKTLNRSLPLFANELSELV